MNNELLEKIEEYNTLLNLFPTPNSSGFGPVCSSKDKIIELSVAHTVDTTLVRDDPANAENYIRSELAQKLAKQIIEEDLIQIQSCEDIEHMNTTFCARVRVVQE